jgi:hypothetical protein
MALIKRSQRKATMSPEMKTAYAQLEAGVRGLGRSMAEIQQGLRKAERKIEADARARIRALRQEAKQELGVLASRRRDATRMLHAFRTAAEGSWRDVKQSADAILSEARTTAASVIERFRRAFDR